jgi:hypothetical protein
VKHVDVEDIDQVKDSEELGTHSPSSGDDDDAAVLVKHLDVALLLELGRRLF